MPSECRSLKYLELFEYLRDGVVTKKLNGEISACNLAYERLTGYSQQELTQMTEMRITPEKWHAIDARIERNQTEKHSYSDVYEKEYIRKDGTVVPIEVQTYVLRNEHGNTIGSQSIVRDISERNQIETEIRESETLQLAIVNSTSDLIWSVDSKDFQILTYNRALEHYFEQYGIHIRRGASIEELLKDPESVTKWRHFYIRALQQHSYTVEYTTILDKRILLLTFNTLTRDSIIFGISCFGQDITQQIRAQEALKLSEENYRKIVDTASEGIWVLDSEHRTIFANLQLANMIGCQIEEIVGKPVEDYIFEEDIDDHRRRMNDRKALITDKYERRFRRSDGQAVWTLVSGTYLLDTQNRFIGSFAMITDISYLKKSENELRAAKDAAESASKIKSQFLDIAAHELRTPLTSMILLIQLFRQQYTERKSNSLTYLDRLTRETQRLKLLIDDLLNVSRLERGGFPMNIVSADLIPIVRETLEDFKSRYPDRILNYEGHIDATLLEIDPMRISQTLANLLDNAIKYTPESSSIEVKVDPLRDGVRVSISDHGPGIPKNQQAELFSRFHRVQSDMTLRQPGLGLGLYFCRRIVELHGGTIAVDSDHGKGTTISFILPNKEKRP